MGRFFLKNAYLLTWNAVVRCAVGSRVVWVVVLVVDPSLSLYFLLLRLALEVDLEEAVEGSEVAVVVMEEVVAEDMLTEVPIKASEEEDAGEEASVGVLLETLAPEMMGMEAGVDLQAVMGVTVAIGKFPFLNSLILSGDSHKASFNALHCFCDLESPFFFSRSIALTDFIFTQFAVVAAPVLGIVEGSRVVILMGMVPQVEVDTVPRRVGTRGTAVGMTIVIPNARAIERSRRWDNGERSMISFFSYYLFSPSVC